ncbi:MAG TPA: DNA polymerase III subunit delta, partial [Stenomitos sp.]
MPTYLFWGDDAFRLDKAVQSLKDRVLNPEWSSFNLDKVESSASSGGEAFVQGLNQAMTLPFGQGDRLVWLVNPPLSGQESSLFVAEVERTLPVLPATTHLLFTYEGKPDGRSKITKLLQQGTVTEFTLTPPWKTDVLRRTVQQVAQELKVSVTDAAADLIAEAVGNDTRLLFSELEKLKLYLAGPDGRVGTITPEAAQALMSTTHQSSLELANAVRQGLTDRALGLAEDLLRCNEP